MALITLAALTMVSCQHDSGDKGDNRVFKPLPAGVYIAGYTVGQSGAAQACYWTGDSRVFLDGSSADSISVSDGTVLVIGPSYFWIDGTRYEFPNYTNRKVVISGGKVYKFDGSATHLWVDGVKISTGYSTNFSAYDIAVLNEKIYLAGVYKPSPQAGYTAGYMVYSGPYYYSQLNDSYYFDDRIWHNITDNNEFIPRAIAVADDGAAYVAGTDSYYNHSKGWYYTKGNFYELEGFDGTNRINKIAVSGGKLYVFGGIRLPYEYLTEYEYWADGEKTTAVVTDYSAAYDAAVSGDKVYMAGYYFHTLPNGTSISAACYWIDGERHDLDGSAATAIFVAE